MSVAGRCSIVSVYLVVVLVLVNQVFALKLPSYIKACSRSDPKINDCARTNGNLAIASIAKGDPKYHIPVMVPLLVPEIVIDSNRELRIKLTNAKINGLETLNLIDINIDLVNNKIAAKAFIPRLEVQSLYDIKGQILVLPITGNGPCNITVVDGTYSYNFDFSLVTKNGKKYAKVGENNLTYDTKRAHFQLDNLFNDQRLSEQMNRVIDENWKEVLKDIGPAITEAVSAIITAIFTGVLDRVPYDEVFLP